MTIPTRAGAPYLSPAAAAPTPAAAAPTPAAATETPHAKRHSVEDSAAPAPNVVLPARDLSPQPPRAARDLSLATPRPPEDLSLVPTREVAKLSSGLPRAPRDHSLVPARARRWRGVRVFASNRVAVLGVALGALVVLAAVGAPFISPLDPFAQSAADRLAGPDSLHVMGRDTFGRDIFARLLHAGRVSLTVGIGSVALGGALGTLLGLVAGSSGRWIETLVMRLVDVLMAFPSLLLGLAVLAVLGAGLDKMILAIGIVLAPPFARVVHAATLSLKEREFVTAARCLGADQMRIVARHVLPNLLGEVVVLASLLTASALRIEASLSFIGLGVSPPTPTWGNMIHDGVPLLLNAPWLAIFPGLAILLSVLAFNLIGDGLRDVLDPRAG